MFYEKNNQTFQILDIMVILAIIMVVCLICSKHGQYFSLKREVGTLSVLGYTRKEITKHAFCEVVATNILSFIVGFAVEIFL